MIMPGALSEHLLTMCYKTKWIVLGGWVSVNQNLWFMHHPLRTQLLFTTQPTCPDTDHYPPFGAFIVHMAVIRNYDSKNQCYSSHIGKHRHQWETPPALGNPAASGNPASSGKPCQHWETPPAVRIPTSSGKPSQHWETPPHWEIPLAVGNPASIGKRTLTP